MKTDCHNSVNDCFDFDQFNYFVFNCNFFLHFCPQLIIKMPSIDGGCFIQLIKMLKRLQEKWKVNAVQLVLILCTFAIGGSLTGFVGKKIMNALAIGQDWIWAIVYILLITIIWPLAVIIVSIPFGQYSFFIKYIRKIGSRFGMSKPKE